MINFVFIGGTYRGCRLLTHLLESDRAPGLVYILKEDDHEVQKFSGQMEDLCKKNGIKYSLKRKIDKNDEKLIRGQEWDFCIVCGWRSMINPDLNKSFKIGMVAAHDSLLPAYRGFAPLNWTIINGEKETGVTLFQINEDMVDSGPVFLQKVVEIGDEDYAADVFEKITQATIDLFSEFFRNYETGQWKLTPQEETKATYTCKRIPEDGQINWNDSSVNVYNLIRGLAHPFPGAYCFYAGDIFRIRKAAPGIRNDLDYVGRIPGRVISITDEFIEVLCGSGSIRLMEWEQASSGQVGCPSVLIRSITATLK